MSELFIFDLGNVMIGNIEILAPIAQELRIEQALLEADYNVYINAMMAGLLPVQDYYRHVEEKFGVKVEGDIFRRHFKPYVHSEMVALVDDLKKAGHRIVMGSNTFDSHWHCIDELDLRRHFDFCYASFEMGCVKPWASFFTYIMFKEGFTADHTHFADDYDFNVEGAKSLGIDARVHTGDAALLREKFKACL